ncbi:MAG: AsmA family protein [Alphaproteobacteria bacterium]|nr:AsmA family protein [Alphaproteobacteria bacterium]MDX5368273.1 AsmA family protein [Alphaproteobacteria bacterium]MDX5463079.1 AsmA family protein [Alphaproteobacteria bacterium]
MVKRRPWGRLALVAGVLLVLAAAVAVVAGPRIVDWQAERPRVAFVLSALTGMEIEIGGDLDLALLPVPRVTATDVRIVGAGGRGALSVARLDARVRVLPLLIGRLDLSDLRLVRPVLRLGDVNVPPRLGPRVLPVALAGVLVEEGRIEIRGADDGPEVIRIPVGTIETQPETGLARLTGEVRLGSHPGSVTLEATVRGGAREVPVRGTLSFPASGAEVAFSGALAHDGVRGRLTARGSLPSGGADPLPLGLAATLAPLDGDHVLRDVEATLGQQSLRGEGRLIGGAAPGVTLALSARRVDARPLLAAGDGIAGLLSGIRDAVPVSLALDAGRVVVPGGTLRDLDVRAQVRGGMILLRQARAILPGDARLGLAGRVVPDEGGLDFSGDGDLQVLRLRETLAWAGLDLPPAAGDRLRTLSVRFSVDHGHGETRVASVSGRLDGIEIAGEGSRIRDGDGCRIEARLSTTDLPLDAYGLGRWPVAEDAWAAPLEACPLALSLAAGTVRHGAVTLQGLEAEVTLAGPAVRAEIARAALSSGGVVTARLGAADGVIRTLEATLASPGLAGDLRSLGLGAPGWLDADVAADLGLTFGSSGAVSLSGTVAEARLEAVGQVTDGVVEALSLTLDGIAGVRAMRLLDAAGLGMVTPLFPDPKASVLSASAAWDGQGRLDLRLSGPDLVFTAAGEGGLDSSTRRLVLERADVEAAGTDGSWSLAGILTRGDGTVRLGQAQLRFGGSAVSGTATLERGELSLALSGGTVGEEDARALLGHLPKLLAGVERLPYAALHLEGALEALTLAGLPLREVTLDADLTARGLTLTSLAAASGASGRLSFTGSLVPGSGGDPVARVGVDIGDVRLDGVLERLTPLDLRAEGTMTGEVSGRLTEDGGLAEPTGELAVAAGPGLLTGLGELPQIAAGFQQGDALAFDRLNGVISLAGPRLLLRDIVAVRDGATALMTALLAPATGALRGAVEVRSASGISQRAPLDPAAP